MLANVGKVCIVGDIHIFICICDLDSKLPIITLLHSEWPKLYGVLAVLGENGLITIKN